MTIVDSTQIQRICLVQLTILRLTPYSKANNGLHCVNANTHQSNQVAFNIRSSISWPIILFTILILIRMEKTWSLIQGQEKISISALCIKVRVATAF